MKPSEKKRKLVGELVKLFEKLDVVQLYHLPRQDATQNWLADTAAVLKNLDEGDYQEFVQLSKVITPTEGNREIRKKAAYEIKALVTRKVAEYKRYDFSSLDKKEPESILKFGEPGKAGQPGGGGTVFMQGNINIADTGRVSADGGNYVGQKNITSGDSSPIQTGDANINIGDITDSFNKIRKQIPQNIDSSNQEKAMELLGSLENELKKDNKEPSKITKIVGQIKRISQWLAGQLIQGAVGGLIKTYLPPVMVAELS